MRNVFISSLFKTKSIHHLTDETYEEHKKLKRVLGPLNLTTLGIGAIIGAGIFVLTGQAAAQYAGPGIVISFVVAGIACAFAGLCYSEFASMIPIAGSAYTYAYATLGEFFAWIIGWDLILEYLFAASTVAVGWSGYVVSFLKDFGIVIPENFSSAPVIFNHETGWAATGSIINLPAVLIIVIISMLLIIGIKESARFNNIIVLLKVTVILLFIGFGFAYVKLGNWTPFIPDNTGHSGFFGWSGIFRASGVIFFAYIGFDAVSTAAQEAKNPQRDMPIGILASLGISTVLYILVALTLTGIVSYKILNVPDPIAVGVNAAGKGLMWLRPFIKLGAVAGLSSVILVLLMGQSRIFYSMSNDGLLPSRFHKLHPKFKTPIFSTIFVGIFAMAIAGLFPIGLLGELVSIGTLLAFLIVCIGIWILRYKRPEIPRPFKTPFVPYVPILGAASALFVMSYLPLDTWLRLIIWMTMGFIIYFSFGHRNSKLRSK
jgi:APA family basic amino acid/polyamine antiporter